MSKREDIQRIAKEATKRFVDEGKLIEAGFAALQVIALQGRPDNQVRDMRIAYLAGAEHVWSSVISMLDAGTDETPADLRRMDMIQKEVDGIRAELSEYAQPTKGRE
jgi:aryl carrier-like protein